MIFVVAFKQLVEFVRQELFLQTRRAGVEARRGESGTRTSCPGYSSAPKILTRHTADEIIPAYDEENF
ncbi:MAG: hypothetical protein DME26_03970 [Verrucomicrobia bacterium]|nr:MAG: hypothetical protein DME26_03970 [Verrucomicrobiota bacterium]